MEEKIEKAGKQAQANLMHVISAVKGGERTRFCVCEDRATEVSMALSRAGFEIEEHKVQAPPIRTVAEKNRAAEILGLLFS